MAPFFFKSQPTASGSAPIPPSKDVPSKKKVKPSTANGQLAPTKSFFSLSNSSRQKLAALDPLSPSLPSTPTLQQQQQQNSPTSPGSHTSSEMYPYPHSLLDERDLYPTRPQSPQLTRSTSAEAPPPSRLNPARLLRRKASGKRKDKDKEREARDPRDEEQLAPEGGWHRRNGSNGSLSLVHSSSLGSFRATSPIDMQYRPQPGFHGRRPSASGSALNLAPTGGFVQETLSSPVMMHHFGSAASLALGYTGSIRSMRSDDSKRLPIPFIHDGDMVVSEVIEHPFLNAGAASATSAPTTTITPSTSSTGTIAAPSIRAPSPSFTEGPEPSPPRRRGGNPPPPLRPQPSLPSLNAFPRSGSPAPTLPKGHNRAQSPMSSDAEEPRITAEWLARKPSTRRRVQPSFTSLARDDRPQTERRASDGRVELGGVEPPKELREDRRGRDGRRGSDGRDRARGSGGTVSSSSGASAEDAIVTPVLSPRLSGLPTPGQQHRNTTFPPATSPYASGGGLGAGLAANFYSQKAGSTSSLRLPVEKHPRACSPSEKRDLRDSREKPAAPPPLPSLPGRLSGELGAGYEVSVQCVSVGEEIRWEVVMRRAKPAPGANGQLVLGKEATTASAPAGAGSVNLNLALDVEQPTGKMLFLSSSEGQMRARTRSSTSPRASRLDGSLPPLPAKETVREKEAPLPPLPVGALPLPHPTHAHSHSFAGRGHSRNLSLAQYPSYGSQPFHPAPPPGQTFQPTQPQPYYADRETHHRPSRPLPIPGPSGERSQLPYAQPYPSATPATSSHAMPAFAGPPLVLEPAAPVERHPNRDKVADEELWREYRFEAA